MPACSRGDGENLVLYPDDSVFGESRISRCVQEGLHRRLFIRSFDGSSGDAFEGEELNCGQAVDPLEPFEPPEAVPRLPPLLPSTSGIDTLIFGLAW